MTRAHESELIDRAQRGEPGAMRELIDAHKDRLHAFVWRMVRNHHDAEELCQDSFLKAFAALDSFNRAYRFSTWLFTIAYRLSLNQLRRKRSRTGEMDFSLVSADEPEAGECVAQSEEAARLKHLVWKAVDQLSPPQKASVLLFYRQEQSCGEIAQVLQLPVSTVKSHLHRARARLRDILEPAVTENLDGLRILKEAAG
ncbi:MAG: RNA polymerase sigma factor [bacterium]|nr:RNA polymerase sigma factor [bacterium]